ncbi:MAG: hypothetical protein IJ727_12300 [Treponema sp.]|nr:hypothetical protein [Treponema sp.]
MNTGPLTLYGKYVCPSCGTKLYAESLVETPLYENTWQVKIAEKKKGYVRKFG